MKMGFHLTTVFHQKCRLKSESLTYAHTLDFNVGEDKFVCVDVKKNTTYQSLHNWNFIIK
jgi:hypothetical protein